MLTFREAIEDVTKMTAGDVHAPTAIGNEHDDEWEGAEQEQEGMESPEEERGERERRVVVKPKAKRFPFKITKADPDQRKIFGWASVAALDGNLVVDKQGDIIPVDELEKAAHDFVLYSRQQGDMHSAIGVGKLIGSLVFTEEKAQCGLVAKDETGRAINGWWVEFLVDGDFWKLYKDGLRLEFSIGGHASYDEVAG